MSADLERAVRSYAGYLDETLPTVTADEIRAAAAERPERVRPSLPWYRRPIVVFAAAMAAVLLIALVPLLLSARGADVVETPVNTVPETETTHATLQNPQELKPTGVHLLTNRSESTAAARDASGSVWASGWGHVVRIDPATGETRVWDASDDAVFAEYVWNMAPAQGDGVWLQVGDSLRWFDGERFVDVVESLPLATERDYLHSILHTSDGGVLVSTLQGGVFRWSGSSWEHVDDERPVVGAGALAEGADGSLWVGNVELARGEEWEFSGRSVSRFDGDRWETFTDADASSLGATAMTIDVLDDGSAWIGTEDGLTHFDSGSWTDYPAIEGPVMATVAPDGTVWAATVRGSPPSVARFDGKTWVSYGTDDGLPGRSDELVTAPIASVAGTSIYVGSGSGLYRLEGDSWVQVLPDPAAGPAEAPTAPLAGVTGITEAGGFLWAWGNDEIWRYSDGDWSLYSSSPTDFGDVAYDGDTLWVINQDARLAGLVEDEWIVPDGAVTVGLAWRIAADPRSGVVWISTSAGTLGRWDGESLTTIRIPEAQREEIPWIGDVAVTSDGALWNAGLYGYVPDLGSLSRYDDTTGIWEPVRLLSNGELVPASLMAPTPDGGLWVVLANWDGGDGIGVEGLHMEGWALAHLDGTTGEWTVYDTELPEGYPEAIAATDEAVWLAGNLLRWDGTTEMQGIHRFDGENWTQTSVEHGAIAMAAAPDRSVWYVTQSGLLLELKH